MEVIIELKRPKKKEAFSFDASFFWLEFYSTVGVPFVGNVVSTTGLVRSKRLLKSS